MLRCQTDLLLVGHHSCLMPCVMYSASAGLLCVYRICIYKRKIILHCNKTIQIWAQGNPTYKNMTAEITTTLWNPRLFKFILHINRMIVKQMLEFHIAHCFSMGQLWMTILHSGWSNTTFCTSLFIHSWTTIFLVGGLGTWGPTKWPVGSPDLTAHDLFLWRWGQRENLPIKTEKTRGTGTTNVSYFVTVPC